MLSALDGKPANGHWKLRVADTAALDTGTIGVFNLHLSTLCACPEIEAEPPPVLTAEGVSPANNAPDPNETVTVNLSLTNAGGVNTSNLVATLLASGGVVNPSGPQNYGAVVAGGGAVTRPFTFTATGACGSFLTLSLQLQDGATSLGVITYSLMLGNPAPPVTFTVLWRYRPGRHFGSRRSYRRPWLCPSWHLNQQPSTATNWVNHTFPDDFDVLLVSPGGEDAGHVGCRRQCRCRQPQPQPR